MSGGAEGNPLFRHGRVRHLRIVGRDESGYVHQHRCFGRLSRRKTYFHDPFVRCRGGLCAKVSINLLNSLSRAYCLKRLAYRERGNTTCNVPLWIVALADAGSTSKGSSTMRLPPFLSVPLSAKRGMILLPVRP